MLSGVQSNRENMFYHGINQKQLNCNWSATKYFAMRVWFLIPGLLIAGLCSPMLGGSVEEARELELAGQPLEARQLLEQLGEQFPRDSAIQSARADFLARYGDPMAVQAYLAALESLVPEDNEQLVQLNRRLVMAALLHGESEVAKQGVAALREAGHGGWDNAEHILDQIDDGPATGSDSVLVPGLLNSFSRMAALSTDLSLDQLLPALGRNIFTGGYHTRGAGLLEPTEFLKLLKQYLTLARELEQLAGPDQMLEVPECESSETAELLRVIGYRLRGECGPGAVLETVNPSRAFLAIDSAFPLADLELSFRQGKQFLLPFGPTRLPVLFSQDYWLGSASRGKEDFLEAFLDDPGMARLYVAMHNLHRPTAEALREVVPVERLKDYANVLDFYGAMFEVRDGGAVLPGSVRSRSAWEKLVKTPVENGGQFFQQLIEADDGWMASFYDSIARVQGTAARAYFTEPERIERFYSAIRGRVTSPGPARPIFRASSDLMLLSARLAFDSSGNPRIPGGVTPWRNLFVRHPHGKYDGKLTASAAGWSDPDDVIEAMFALCRKVIENEPLRIFLAVSDIERNRQVPLTPVMVDRMIDVYPRYGEQFTLYNDSPNLTEETIDAHFNSMERLDKIGNLMRRANALGVMQALSGIWQALCRNGSIPDSKADESLFAISSLVNNIEGSQEIFEAGREGVMKLLEATGHEPSESPQQVLLELLVGEPGMGEQAVQVEILDKLNQLLALQKLVPLKTLFDLADHLERVSRGEEFNVAMANRLSASISDIRLPRSLLSNAEANVMARGHWVDRHIERQRTLNLRRAVDRAEGNPRKLLEIRGELAPILRDSLVGILYALYSPSGAELIRANPLFVRSHDFLGTEARFSWKRTRTQGSGWPSSGGGRLVGSLMSLPYELAVAEQNFMVPSERQALIWQDLAPQVMLGATLPRWWQLHPSELHYVGLHLRLGRAMLVHAALEPDAAPMVLERLRGRVEPSRIWRLGEALRKGRVHEGLNVIAPSELFDLAHYLRSKYREQLASTDDLYLTAIEELIANDAERYNEQRISRLFGMPHPRLAHSYRLELLNLPLFPTLMGYSSRILAESWESNNLYWAELFDKHHLAPARLNLLVPQWTQWTLERIFATHLDDWPALWRSLRIIAERVDLQIRTEQSVNRIDPLPSEAGTQALLDE